MQQNSSSSSVRSQLAQDTQAVTTLEYALIAAVMMVLVGGAAQSIGNHIGHKLRIVTDAITVTSSPLRVSGEVVPD